MSGAFAGSAAVFEAVLVAVEYRKAFDSWLHCEGLVGSEALVSTCEANILARPFCVAVGPRRSRDVAMRRHWKHNILSLIADVNRGENI